MSSSRDLSRVLSHFRRCRRSALAWVETYRAGRATLGPDERDDLDGACRDVRLFAATLRLAEEVLSPLAAKASRQPNRQPQSEQQP